MIFLWSNRASRGSSSVFMLTIVLPLLLLLMLFGVELTGYVQRLERQQIVTDEAARAALQHRWRGVGAVQKILSDVFDLHFGPSKDRVVSVSNAPSELIVQVSDGYNPKILLPFLNEGERITPVLSLSTASTVRIERPSSIVVIDTIGSQGTICEARGRHISLRVGIELANEITRSPRDDSSIWLLESGASSALQKVECGAEGCDFSSTACPPAGVGDPTESMRGLLEYLVTREQQRSINLPPDIRGSIGTEQVFYFSLFSSSEVAAAYAEADLISEELNRRVRDRNGRLQFVVATAAGAGDPSQPINEGSVVFSPITLPADETPSVLAARLMSLRAVELVAR